MKPTLSKMLTRQYNFEKKYRVYIEVTGRNGEGYVWLNPKSVNEKSNNDFFLLSYSFKMVKGKKNPLFIIEKLEGRDFEERTDIINHFARFHALQYSVECDGFHKI